MSKELWIRAEEAWIEQFIDDNDREPTEDEIEEASVRAYENYIADLTDNAYEQMRERNWK